MPENYFDVSIEEKEFADALKAIEEARNGLDAKYLKSVQRRKLRPMASAMKASAPGNRLRDFIGISTAKKKAGDLGAKVGVVKKSDPTVFPKFTAQALAAVNEYGTEERFRKLRTLGLITGRQSTGEMPEREFLRPVWDSHVNKFMDDVQDAIEKKIEKEFG